MNKILEIQHLQKLPGIYCIRNKINNLLYIGSSINVYKRIRFHLYDFKRNKHSNDYLQKAWNKYGKGNFDFIMIACVLDKKDLFNIEQDFMNEFETYNRDKGYNLSPCAGGMHGYKFSENIKDKKSKKFNFKPFICIETKQIFTSMVKAANHIGVKSKFVSLCYHKKALSVKGYHFIILSHENSTEEQIDQDIKNFYKENTLRNKEKNKSENNYKISKHTEETKQKFKELYGKKIICNETKEIFYGIRDINRKLKISRDTVQNQLRGFKTPNTKLTFSYLK